VLGQDTADPARPSALDSAGHMPRGLVIDPQFAWHDDKRPWRLYSDTVIYEVHVKGWRTEVNTYDPATPASSAAARGAGDHVTVSPRSIAVLRAASPR
jgi:pullulanase/glycogen debranching enzyme